MHHDIILQLEDKVHHAMEIIRLLRAQIEALEDENTLLKADYAKWREEIRALHPQRA